MKVTLSWLSIVSFLLNIVLTGLGLYQFLDAQKNESNTQVMVRSWQNQAEGIVNGLLSISQNPKYFSTTTDMAVAVGVSAQSATALNSAISQQRFYTDQEVRKQKEDASAEIKKMMDEIRLGSRN